MHSSAQVAKLEQKPCTATWPYARPAIDVRSALTLVIKMKADNQDVDEYYPDSNGPA